MENEAAAVVQDKDCSKYHGVLSWCTPCIFSTDHEVQCMFKNFLRYECVQVIISMSYVHHLLFVLGDFMQMSAYMHQEYAKYN